MRAIAIGVAIWVVTASTAAAQTAAEQARILQNFQVSVAQYSAEQHCLDMFPEAVNATTPAPKLFTPPVAIVFRQVIARTLAERDGVAVISGVSGHPHPTVLEPFPPRWLDEFPRVLEDALPPLPTPLEYRLVGHDLVIRDREADLIVGVLKEAVGPALTVIR